MKYNSKSKGDYPIIKSPLTSFPSLSKNYVEIKAINEYEKVGQYAFTSLIHPKAKLPCVDFPSFRWLDIKEFTFDVKYVNKVPFKRMLVNIQRTKEDLDPSLLENYIKKFLAN